ncbi:MAG TPA: putative collagen-binding domain-containing protein, partial [Phycisphaerae bacterium]|nr:putative collagen-binding domain-containing protein [Phycisphaerae bacterium]
YQTREVHSPQFSEMGMAMSPHGWLYPYLRILGSLMRSLPFSQMTLHPELAGNGVCLAQVPHRYVCYAPNGGTITLNLSASSGTLQARWLNPRAGGFGSPVPVQGGQNRTFAAPDANDWVLYVEDSAVADTIAPGAPAAFTAAAGRLQNTLTWTNPHDGDVTGVLIRFSTSGYPAGPTDGQLLADEPGEPQWPYTVLHVGLTRGITYYYSAFAHDWMMNHGPAAHAQAIPVGPADFDWDGDVDQTDFGHFQACISGSGVALSPGCEDADLAPDGAVDQNDLSVFRTCMGGSDQPPGC